MTASKTFLCLHSLIQLSIGAATYSHDKSMDKFNRILVCTAFAKVSGPKPPRHMVKAITAHRRSSYFHQRLLQKAIKAPQHISTNPWLAEKNTTLLQWCLAPSQSMPFFVAQGKYTTSTSFKGYPYQPLSCTARDLPPWSGGGHPRSTQDHTPGLESWRTHIDVPSSREKSTALATIKCQHRSHGGRGIFPTGVLRFPALQAIWSHRL